MKSALSFLLLLLLPLVRSIDLGFIVSPLESDSPLLPSLQSRFDVRAIFDETLLLIGNQESFAKIQKLLPKAHLSSPYNPKETYVLIERPEFAFSTSKEEATWAFLTLQKIQELNLVVILSEPQRFVVGLNGMRYDGLFDHFPSETEILALPKEGIKPINRSITKELEIAKRIFVRRDDIADLVAQMSVDSMLDYDRFLTGERNDSSFNSRNSFSPEVGDAANWISSVYESHGFSTDLHYFQSNYGPNVIAVYPGSVEPNRYVVIGAHFDSRATSSSSPTQRAPGANDDGSGTAILLEISRLISKNQLKFRYSVIIGSWCGEEQGLVGSRAYAKQCRNEGVDIVAMLQGDMLAYRKPGEAAQCAFPNRYHTPELTSLLKEVVTTYVPKVQVCDTSACCSDHQGFYEQGYAATQFFERCGSIADDQYHREGDLVDRTGFDLEQWLYNGQAMFSSLLTVAELV